MVKVRRFKKTYLGRTPKGRRWAVDASLDALQMLEEGGDWIDINPRWEGNRVIGAPYDLVRDGDKLSVTDRITGNKGTLELISTTPLGLKAEVVLANTCVSFQHILPSDKVPFEAQFKVEGKIAIHTRAFDNEGELELEVSIKGGILTEKLSQVRDKRTGKLRQAKGNIMVDPTLDLQVGTNLDDVFEDEETGAITDSSVVTFWSSTDITKREWGGVRWSDGVAIPRYSTIDVAYAKLMGGVFPAKDINIDIHFEKAASPAQFTTGDYSISSKARTTALVGWDEANGCEIGVWAQTPSLVTPLQEVVNNYDITAIVAIFKARNEDLGWSAFIAYNYGDHTAAPWIHLEWTEAWLPGYGYRQKVPLKRTDGAVSAYQMKLTVHKGTGDSLEDVVYLKNHALSWTGTVPNDVRFTGADSETELDYWIESSDANTATVWIEFDSIGTTDTYFYVYYGKSGDTTTSNGDNTFPFFDDFPGDSLDTDKWDVLETDAGCTQTVQDGYLKLTVPGGGWQWSSVVSKALLDVFGCAFEVTVRLPDTDCYMTKVAISPDRITANTDDIADLLWLINTHDSSHTEMLQQKLDGAILDIHNFGDRQAENVWVDNAIRAKGSDQVKAIRGADDSGWQATTIDFTSGYIKLAIWHSDAREVHYSIIKVRKYIDPEPTWGTWGSEETGVGAIQLTVTDGIKLGDSNKGNLTIGVSLIDGLKGGDSIGSQAILNPLLIDGIKLSDLPSTLGAIYNLMLADGIKASDAVSMLLALNPVLTDSVKLGDMPATQVILNTELADGIKLSDVALTNLILSLLVSDGIKLSGEFVLPVAGRLLTVKVTTTQYRAVSVVTATYRKVSPITTLYRKIKAFTGG